MQHQGDRPVRGGRPSLLSPEEQPVQERQGILSSLDGMTGQAAAAQRQRPRSRALAWGGAAAGAIAVCGALFLFGGNGDHTVPAAAPVQVAAAPPAPVTPVSLPAAVPAAPTTAVLRDEPAAPLEPMTNPLADMAAPAEPAHNKERAAKAEKSAEKSAKADKAERREAHAKAAHAKAQEKTREAAKEKKTKAKPVREQDSDVVLLAALMSHMDPKKGKATPAEQLESCRRYNAAGEEQCRARVCAAAGRKEPACKRVQAARADSES
ncbi:hypothetical protein SAMN05428966_12141 [Massilia sp. PDC64]|nr:hypothetical protein [Massilia sp. PDC64]SDF77208.1 hypothetical protein SAMN05428966_12141 [Massilia sp. PDC64]